MDRTSLATLVVALLAVAALAIGAATVDTTVPVGDDGSTGSSSGSLFGGGPESTEESTDEQQEPSFAPPVGCVESLLEPRAIAIVLLVWFVIGGLAYLETRSLFAAGVVMLAIGLLAGPFYAMLAICGDPFELSISLGNSASGGGVGGLFGGEGESGDGQNGEATTVPLPTAVFGLVLVVALVLSVFLFAVGGREPTGDLASDATATDDDEATTEEIASIGEHAGEAADRIEATGAVENEVYHAWAEMARSLDVPSPETSTPAAFAAAAVDAGMDPADVEALTAVFEAVRYGGAAVTPEREQRAVAALRRIEQTYAEDTDG
ncbi:DUF4129 domain-containing protein [Halalkalirubrum salinum]|uniref:DUF4129 domain-containing protein n=1 Tax=Halalkalirubrum salinum TaxID=2563889 RepID=UPI0010FB80E6|nr:DUF4129 domain-containing protein [Halalkalirubrum salinum]